MLGGCVFQGALQLSPSLVSPFQSLLQLLDPVPPYLQLLLVGLALLPLMPTLLGVRWVLIARPASVTRGGLLRQLKQRGKRGLLVQVGDG